MTFLIIIPNWTFNDLNFKFFIIFYFREAEISKVPKISTKIEWEPHNWRAQLDNIKSMRSSRDAPVDSIGAAALPESDCSPEVSR